MLHVRYASRPDQWRSKQASRESAYKEFHDTFGSGRSKSLKTEFLADSSKHTSHLKDVKTIRQEIEHHATSDIPFLSMSGFKGKSEKGKQGGKTYSRPSTDNNIFDGRKKSSKRKRNNDQSENVEAGKRKRNNDQSENAEAGKRKRKV